MTIGKSPFGISSGGVWLIQSRRMMSTPSFAPNLTLIPPLWELIQGLLNGIYESLSFRLNVLPFGTRIWRGSERGDTKHRCVPLPQSNGLCHTGKNPWRLGQKESWFCFCFLRATKLFRQVWVKFPHSCLTSPLGHEKMDYDLSKGEDNPSFWLTFNEWVLFPFLTLVRPSSPTSLLAH